MNKRLALFLFTASVVALLTQACSRPPAPQESCNFVQNPDLQRVSWQARLPVKLYLHKSVPQEAYAVIDRAISEYNTRLGDGREIFKVIARGVDGELAAKKDGYSTIYWFKTWDPQRKTEQARTTIYWTGSEIFEADLRINAANFSYYLGENSDFENVDFMSLIVHELGHALGLGHNVSHGSVMNFTLDEGEIRRKLADLDVTSLKCEY